MANGTRITPNEFFDDEFLAQFPELAAELGRSASLLFPDSGLSEEERRERQQLEERAQRLSPIDIPEPAGSTRIAGNPFSFDITPATGAISEGIEKIINAERQRRLMGDSGEAAALKAEAEQLRQQGQGTTGTMGDIRGSRQLLSRAAGLEEQADGLPSPAQRLADLNQQEETGQASEAARMELITQMFPDLAGRMFQMEKEMAVNEQERAHRLEQIGVELGADLTRFDRQSTNRINELNEDFKNELEKIEFENEQTETGGRDISAGDINNLRQISNEMTGVVDADIAKKRVDLNTAQSIAQSERRSEEERQTARAQANQLQADIENLEAQKRNIMNNVFSRAAQQLNMSEDEIRTLYLSGTESETENPNAIDYNSILNPE